MEWGTQDILHPLYIMAAKTPPLYLWHKYSEAKFRQLLKSDLRKLWLRWPPRNAALKAARRKIVMGLFKNGSIKYGYEHQCCSCLNWFPTVDGKPQVEVDHIIPVGGFSQDITKWSQNLGDMYGRTLVEVSGLRILCKECHQKITNAQREK